VCGRDRHQSVDRDPHTGGVVAKFVADASITLATVLSPCERATSYRFATEPREMPEHGLVDLRVIGIAQHQRSPWILPSAFISDILFLFRAYSNSACTFGRCGNELCAISTSSRFNVIWRPRPC
jgi:hypothetical protein